MTAERRRATSPFADLPAACRAFLRGVDDAHPAQCPACTERLAGRPALGQAMANVAMPAELRSRAMLERVLDAIVTQAEAAPLGAVLGQTLTVANSLPVGDEHADEAGEVAAARLLAEATPLQTSPVTARLAGRMAANAVVAEPAWQSVQASIYGRVRAEAAARRRLWPLGAVGAAAAAVLFLLLMRESSPKRPEIAFADLTALPNVDFAILRYGPPR